MACMSTVSAKSTGCRVRQELRHEVVIYWELAGICSVASPTGYPGVSGRAVRRQSRTQAATPNLSRSFRGERGNFSLRPAPVLGRKSDAPKSGLWNHELNPEFGFSTFDSFLIDQAALYFRFSLLID